MPASPTEWQYRRPIAPGLYWWQRPGGEARLVNLQRDDNRRSDRWWWQVVFGSLWTYSDSQGEGGRWSGPVAPPADEPWAEVPREKLAALVRSVLPGYADEHENRTEAARRLNAARVECPTGAEWDAGRVAMVLACEDKMAELGLIRVRPTYP